MSCLDEATVVAFIGGRARADQVRAVDLHLDECRACRELLVQAALATHAPALSIQPHDDRADPLPLASERYQLTDLLGYGAQGLVYAARDTLLDRTVAIKVVRSAGGHARMLDEARLVARIQHPNIVAIHDAGTTSDGALYLAMELVDGGTLAQWRIGPDRSRAEVLRICLDAGRGLAAAHDAGIVHRDVKPTNVLVGRDGRARIGDFGLAIARPDGRIAGTPAYMAPEQRDGEATTRSDQYGYAVVVWEALTGALPAERRAAASPAGRSSPAPSTRDPQRRDAPPRGAAAPAAARGLGPRAEAARDPAPTGDLDLRSALPARAAAAPASASTRPAVAPASIARLPRHLAAALRRALSEDPERRFPSMRELVAALAVDPRARRRRWMVAGGLVAALGAAAAVLVTTRDRRAPACDAVAGELDPVWNVAVRTRLVGQIASARLPYAAATADATARALDDYARAWVAARTRSCEATAVRGEQTTELRELATQCLDERRTALDIAARTLATADPRAIERAADLVAALPAIEPCTQASWLRDRAPIEPAARAAVATAARSTAEASATVHAGSFDGARAIADRAIAEAERAGHAPTIARAYATRGEILGHGGDHTGARADLERAVDWAQRGRDDLTAAGAWIELVYATGYAGGRHDEALRFASLAEATLARAGGSPKLRATLDAYRCAVLDQLGRRPEAIAACAAARTTREALDGPRAPTVATVLVLEARLLAKLGKFAEATRDVDRVIEIRRGLGADHPSLVEAYFTAGQVAAFAGQFDRARAYYDDAIALAQRSFGDASVLVASVWGELGSLTYQRGDLPGALAHIERALEIRERVLGSTHASLVFDLIHRGRILDGLGRLDAAEASLARAQTIAETRYGPRHEAVQTALMDLGRVHAKLGRAAEARAELERALQLATESGDPLRIASAASTYAELLHGAERPRDALRYYQQALAAYESIYRADHPQLYAVLFNLGTAHLDLEDAPAAVPYLRRALAIQEAAHGPTSLRTFDALFTLADALEATGDRAAARTLRQRAVELPGAAAQFPDDVKQVRAKLRAR